MTTGKIKMEKLVEDGFMPLIQQKDRHVKILERVCVVTFEVREVPFDRVRACASSTSRSQPLTFYLAAIHSSLQHLNSTDSGL